MTSAPWTYDAHAMARKDVEHPGHTAAFAVLMKLGHQADSEANRQRPIVDGLMNVRDDELVMLGQVLSNAHLPLWKTAIDAEIARRGVDALNRNRLAVDE